MAPSKAERLAEFVRRLNARPSAATFDDARRQLEEVRETRRQPRSSRQAGPQRPKGVLKMAVRSPQQRVQAFSQLLRRSIAGCSVEVDPPSSPTGRWFIDVTAKGQSFVVEFRPKLGFGISSTPADGYGEGADEFFPEAEE